MNKYVKLAAVAVALGVLAGCGTKGEVKPEDGAVVEDRTTELPESRAPAEEPVAAPAEEEGPEARALAGREGLDVSSLDDPDSPLYEKVVYFDYDKAEVKEEFRPMLRAHAEFLAANPNMTLVLEGHTDERGSREYNIGLGERRAEAVRRLLLFQGATDQQIRTVSYGEERPAVEGHDEAAWSKNRRVELVYER